jgi:hypothetical protein
METYRRPVPTVLTLCETALLEFDLSPLWLCGFDLPPFWESSFCDLSQDLSPLLRSKHSLQPRGQFAFPADAYYTGLVPKISSWIGADTSLVHKRTSCADQRFVLRSSCLRAYDSD